MKLYSNRFNQAQDIPKLNLTKRAIRNGTIFLSAALILLLVSDSNNIANNYSINQIQNLTTHNEPPYSDSNFIIKDSNDDIITIDSEEEIVTDPYLVVSDRIKNDEFNSKKFFLNHDEFILSSELNEKINKLITSRDKKNSFYAVSLDGSISMGYNIDSKQFAACVVKAPYAMYCYKEIENGNGTLNEKMIYEQKHYHGGSGTIQHSKYGTKYTLDEIIFRSLNISDNAAYAMSRDRFPIAGYSAMLTEIGCEDMIFESGYKFGNATARETALLWHEIYKYSQESEYGAKLFDILLGAKYNYIKDAIPQYEIAHKSGWTSAVRNDAGIVFGQIPYIIVVLTPNDPTFFKQAVQLTDQAMSEYQIYLSNQQDIPEKRKIKVR